EADSRIDIGVKNIDEQVDRQDQHGLHDDDGLQQREITEDHRLVGQPPDPGPGEHGLGDDRAGDQIADEHPPQGQHRDQGVAQAVLPDHDVFAEALDAGELNELAFHHLEHARADQPHKAGDQEHAQGYDR